VSARPSSFSTLGRALRTVGSAMFGVRGSKRHEEDAAAVSPVALLVVALVCVVLFVAGLITLASMIVGA
jgi:hypothetical protein